MHPSTRVNKKRVEDLKKGDLVYSLNGLSALSETKITQYNKQKVNSWYKLFFKDDDTYIYCSDQVLIYEPKKCLFIPVKDIRPYYECLIQSEFYSDGLEVNKIVRCTETVCKVDNIIINTKFDNYFCNGLCISEKEYENK